MVKHESDSAFLSSITDLMTSLAVIFILLLVVYMAKAHAEANKLQKEIDNLKDIEQSTHNIKKELKTRLADVKLPFEDDPNDALTVVYCVPQSKLEFRNDSAELNDDGKTYLREHIPDVMKVITEKEMLPNIGSILIEGHTDSKSDDEYNLQLSQERAFNVLQYSLDGCNLDPKSREWFLYYTSANGRGERDLLPVGSRPGFENEQASRRVEFKIRVKSIEQKADQLKALLKGKK